MCELCEALGMPHEMMEEIDEMQSKVMTKHAETIGTLAGTFGIHAFGKLVNQPGFVRQMVAFASMFFIMGHLTGQRESDLRSEGMFDNILNQLNDKFK